MTNAAPSTFDRNVFINCPFDVAYTEMFNALVFTIIDCGFYPRSALEEISSSTLRLEKICKLIKQSRLSVHDLSRNKMNTFDPWPRFNMPFELGIFTGMNYASRSRKQHCIVFDTEEHLYQRYLSDLSGADIMVHGNDILTAIRCTRKFLANFAEFDSIPGAKYIHARYNEFKRNLPGMLEYMTLEESDLTFPDKCQLMSVWCLEGLRVNTSKYSAVSATPSGAPIM